MTTSTIPWTDARRAQSRWGSPASDTHHTFECCPMRFEGRPSDGGRHHAQGSFTPPTWLRIAAKSSKAHCSLIFPSSLIR
jgi:hypothetical protein